MATRGSPVAEMAGGEKDEQSPPPSYLTPSIPSLPKCLRAGKGEETRQGRTCSL